MTRTTNDGFFVRGQADGLGRLTGLTIDLAGKADDNVTSFAYNPASQVASRELSNNATFLNNVITALGKRRGEVVSKSWANQKFGG